MSLHRQPSQRERVVNENTKQVYEYIRDYYDANGFAPSLDEIADACYLSRSTVVRYLDRLEAWGLVTRQPGVPRSLILNADERGKLRGL